MRKDETSDGLDTKFREDWKKHRQPEEAKLVSNHIVTRGYGNAIGGTPNMHTPNPFTLNDIRGAVYGGVYTYDALGNQRIINRLMDDLVDEANTDLDDPEEIEEELHEADF